MLVIGKKLCYALCMKNKRKETMDQISIWLPKGTNNFLNEYSKCNGVTKKQLVKNAIEEYCNVDLDNDFGLKD